MSNHRPQKGSPEQYSQRLVTRLFWVRSAWCGCVVGLILVVVMIPFDKVWDFLASTSFFDAVPYALISALVGLLWGLRPALFTMAMGLIAIAIFVAPGLVSPNMGRDLAIFAPFVALQLVAIMTVMRFESARRRIHAAQQMTQTYARELEEANQRLLQANEQLERANALKDFVILRSAHELRTPAATILGRAQLALRRLNRSGETPENWAALRQYFELIEAQAQTLRVLIEELFDLSSVRAGQYSLRLAWCDPGRLCREVIQDQQAVSARSIELELPAEPLLLQADEKRLAQVVVNLVNNAVKYSPEQSAIHVRVRPVHPYVILEVHNEGKALTQEQREHIFEPFYRTPDAENTEIKGWGLGLAISQEIVERHGGQIWVESTEGKGVTFFVKLPMSQQEK
ncbi:MAG TPA: HAMP domain-containing sensor histidine kinase [Ktedonobacteraceae bacterium]|nr:HAMP domain-containing sensor histidine kinase [Ktedonobacteraceae bacterium]HZU67056.1 HAMP domain-containing sensor histidine kinase [Ktedonobacteraceae bacterium]